jgi:hypothetical protein
MIAIDCPTCRKRIQAPDASAGKIARCPACKGAVAVALPARRGLLASPIVRWGLAALGSAAILLVVILALGAFMSGRAEDLLEYGRKRTAADISDPETRGVTLALVRALHNKAIHQSVPRDLRGRQRISMPDPEAYYGALRTLIGDELRTMEGGPPFDSATLAGFWESKDCGKGTAYVVHLKRDGTFRDAAFELADSGYRIPTPMDGGTWQYKAGVLTWRAAGGQDDPNPVVRKGALGFVLREMDGSYTYFHRIAPPPTLAQRLQ